MGHYYDKNGTQISLYTWGRLLQEDIYRQIAFDKIGDREVSTVWLGLDHRFKDVGDPLIFETLVFDASGAPRDRDRYSTLKEAEAGHAARVKLLRETLC